MKGLLIKDFLNIKGFGRMAILLLVVFFVVAAATGDTSYVASFLLIYCAMIPMTSLALDEQAKWGAYAQCMPVSRRQVVLSKYLMPLIMVGLAAILSLLFSLLAGIKTPVVWGDVLRMNLITLSLIIIVNAISIPPMLKYGVEKARILIMILFMLCIFAVTYTIGEAGIQATLTGGAVNILPAVLPAVALAVYGGSFLLSDRIYASKEF